MHLFILQPATRFIQHEGYVEREKDRRGGGESEREREYRQDIHINRITVLYHTIRLIRYMPCMHSYMHINAAISLTHWHAHSHAKHLHRFYISKDHRIPYSNVITPFHYSIPSEMPILFSWLDFCVYPAIIEDFTTAAYLTPTFDFWSRFFWTLTEKISMMFCTGQQQCVRRVRCSWWCVGKRKCRFWPA